MYHISHTLTYQYDRPVTFTPHLIHLRPRSDAFQNLQQFSLHICPAPSQLSENVDLDGNSATIVHFEPLPTTSLTIQAFAQVETYLVNPFEYLLESWATQLPINYPATLTQRLQPYLQGYLSHTWAIDPLAAQLGQEIWLATNGHTTAFLMALNQRIYQSCQYLFRETGDPLPPGVTWNQRGGSCRDMAVLFMEVCRSVGLAARFVSGYQESSAAMTEAPATGEQHLHAWAEVYLPGAGWRGYDPTHGLAVANDHIVLAASPYPPQASPAIGALLTGKGAQATLSYQLSIQKSSAIISSI